MFGRWEIISGGKKMAEKDETEKEKEESDCEL